MASLIEFLNVTLLRFYRLAVSKDTTTVFLRLQGPLMMLNCARLFMYMRHTYTIISLRSTIGAISFPISASGSGLLSQSRI